MASKESSLSVVCPAYNEGLNLPIFIESVAEVAKKSFSKHSFELIIVDDGSTDNTTKIVEKYRTKFAKSLTLKIKTLPSNRGHNEALWEGIKLASKEYILTMDSDGQHPVSMIPGLYAKRDPKIIQIGKQVSRQDKWVKRITTEVFYWVITLLGFPRKMIHTADFRFCHSHWYEKIRKRPKQIVRVLFVNFIDNVETFSYEALSRIEGESKYTFAKMLRFGWLIILTLNDVKMTSKIRFISVPIAFLFAVFFSFVILH